MVWGLLAAHLIGIAASGLAGRRSMRSALAIAALAPALTACWVAVRIAVGAEPITTEVMWVQGLDLSFRFRIDALAELMTVLVSGIGALVFVYAIGYFGPAVGRGVRFPTSLLAFSLSMLGLVWADSVWTLFIFWELTSITSFLLVGYKNTELAVRLAARRALMITGAGGLVLLAGLMVMVNETGNTSLTGLSPSVGVGSLAAVLIMIGAATKSAQVPFHVWLPGAMAAPTPVSAYLHSATMVKAGVFLIAVVGPVFSDTAAWKIVGAAFGIVSMMWGAIGALRQRDAKLILAWGTVSQLGLMFTLFSIGSAKATFAGISIVFAHGLFKAALFMVVGEVDVRTGTRDIAELGGLWRSMPIAFAAAVAAALSMAGAPPLLGFMAKEAAIEASLGLGGAERWIFTGAIVIGSILTVAYTTRFMIGTFGPGPATEVQPRRTAMTAPSVLLGAAGVVGYLAVGVANRIIAPAATELNAKADRYQLIRWPGLTTAFILSALVLILGTVVGLVLARRAPGSAPKPVGAERADALIDGVIDESPRVAAFVQHGSLPIYVATMGLVASIAASPFVVSLTGGHLVWWDHPLEPVVAITVVICAVVVTFVPTRLEAALSLGAIGLAMSALFVVRGAPDLALTQLLVETIIVVGFVLGLGRLHRAFPSTTAGLQTIRIGVAAIGGLAVTAALAAATARPTGTAPVEALTEGAVTEGGGKNVVNVILTDIRALDTLGEVVVLATVAVGMLALAKVRRAEADE